ncbi:MAG TPA: hypothetical protein VI653_21370 [Steroidobacteraceae bacterium]
MTGCSPRLLTSMQFQGDQTSLSGAASRFIAAGGTLANLAAAAAAITLLHRRRSDDTPLRFFLWLFATVNLLQGTGYLLFSGLGNVGDWSAVVRGWAPHWLWRVTLAAVGGIAYYGAAYWAMRQLATWLRGSGGARVREAYRYTLTAYATGALLYVTAGLLDPNGPIMVLLSGVSASLGGTSALLWGPQLLDNPLVGAGEGSVPPVPRDWRWIVAATATIALFVFVLGPGVTL